MQKSIGDVRLRDVGVWFAKWSVLSYWALGFVALVASIYWLSSGNY